MFEFLNEEDVKDAFPAGHQAIQFVRQWRLSGFSPSITALTPSQGKVVERIIEEIEMHEGTPVAELSQEKVDKYIVDVSKKLEGLSRQQLKADETRGRSLLEALRSYRS